MKSKKTLRLLIKFSLLDDLFGLIYWAAALYGLLKISDYATSPLVMALALVGYIILIVVVYFWVAKKLTLMLSDDNSES